MFTGLSEWSGVSGVPGSLQSLARTIGSMSTETLTESRLAILCAKYRMANWFVCKALWASCSCYWSLFYVAEYVWRCMFPRNIQSPNRDPLSESTAIVGVGNGWKGLLLPSAFTGC